MTRITIDRAVVEHALEALELVTDLTNHDDEIYEAIIALRAALATGDNLSPTEPVAWVRALPDGRLDRLSVVAYDDEAEEMLQRSIAGCTLVPLYTAPPQRKPEPRTKQECFDPACACRGGPCAECPEGEREKEISDLRFSLEFYKRRADALQIAQRQMRDPERTMVCDVLANGCLLAPAGDRYTAPPQRKPLSEEEIDKAYREIWADLPSDFDHTSAGWIEEGIRYAERAHGITP